MILTYASQQDYDAMSGKPTDKAVWSAADFAAMGAFMEAFNKDLAESGLSGADIAVVLDVSPQRVSQLLNA